jgi:hypothetical protein
MISALDAFDLTGEHSVLPAQSYAEQQRPSLAMQPLTSRARQLAACRESHEFDHVLMAGMVQQTLHYLPDSPGVRLARELELRPMQPDFRHPRVNRVEIREGRASAVLFEIDGDYYLYSMTSAAKSNARGENHWTNICAEVICAVRPIEVYVASASRLVRSFEHSATLLSAISKNVDVVHAGDTAMRMRGRGADMGQMMWAMLATIAASERNLIVQRLTAGVVAKYRRGEWVKGAGAVPLGYALDPATRRLGVDPGQLAALQTAWTLMADPRGSAWQVLQRLSDLGVSSPLAKSRYGEGSTVGDLKDAETYLAQLRRWSHVYLTGRHTTRWTNPFEGAPHIAGMPVYPTADGKGELRFEYDFGRPDLDPALIQAGLDARKARVGDPVTGGAARQRVAPLNGIRWLQHGLEFWLTSTRDIYELRARGQEET